jgi:hypothetical protein
MIKSVETPAMGRVRWNVWIGDGLEDCGGRGLEELGGEGGSMRDDIVVEMKLKEVNVEWVECGHFKWRLIRPKLISWPYYTEAVSSH